MKVFVSWSGDMSHQAARALRDLLPRVLPTADIRLWDDRSLQAGSQWVSVLERELARAEAAAPCVTRENVASPWLNFEVGLLSSMLGRHRVFPLLIDLSMSHLRGPLSQFECFSTSRPEFRRFVGALATVGSAQSPDEAALDALFETWWPEISSGLHVLRGVAEAHAPAGLYRPRGSMRRVDNLDALAAVVSRDPTEEELESVVATTMRESGVRVIRHAPDRRVGADLALWVDELDPQLGNPILVEVKSRIRDSAAAAEVARQAGEYVNRAATRTILVVYGEGPDQTRMNREFGGGGVIFLRLPDLLQRLRSEPLDAVIQRELLHKAR